MPHHAVGLAVDGENAHPIAVPEQAHRPGGAFVGEIHLSDLTRPLGHARGHAPAAVHDDRHRHAQLALVFAQFHGHRQELVHGRLEIAARSEGRRPAQHQQATALAAHKKVEPAQELVRHAGGRHVIKHHQPGPA